MELAIIYFCPKIELFYLQDNFDYIISKWIRWHSKPSHLKRYGKSTMLVTSLTPKIIKVIGGWDSLLKKMLPTGTSKLGLMGGKPNMMKTIGSIPLSLHTSEASLLDTQEKKNSQQLDQIGNLISKLIVKRWSHLDNI